MIKRTSRFNSLNFEPVKHDIFPSISSHESSCLGGLFKFEKISSDHPF